MHRHILHFLMSVYYLYILYLLFFLLFYSDIEIYTRKIESEELCAEVRAFATFKSSMSHTRRLWFFFFYKIIIDFSPLSYQLRSAWTFFLSLSSSKNLTPDDLARVFIPTNHTRERCGTRFVDKLRLSARRTSIVISIAVRSLSCAALDCCRQDTHGGCLWIYVDIHSVRRVYFGAPTAKPQTRGLARPNLKPKPTLLPRG